MFDDMTPDQWLSLSEASSVLGVHASTLRRWADSGRVPCQRTPGGHRRFSRRKLVQMLEGPPLESGRTTDVNAASEQPWHAAFEEAGIIADLREVGQRLTGIAMQFLLRENDDERYLNEVRLLAERYAMRSRGAGIDLLVATEAFLFFRSAYIDMLGQLRAADPAAGMRLFGRYEKLMGEVLLALVANYQTSPAKG
jgi:excisionase family DNA binding protein